MVLAAPALFGATESLVLDSKTHQVQKPSVSSTAPADFNFTGLTVLGIVGSGGGGGTPIPGPTGPPGPPGPPGADGRDGAQGDPGAVGPQGVQGPIGPIGPAGANGTSVALKGSVANVAALPSSGNVAGDLWITLDTGHGWVWSVPPGTWSDVGPIQGPAGSPGPQGSPGVQGPQGLQGPKGIPGPTGSPGPQGIPGPTGTAGPQGLQGPQGLIGPQGAAGPQGPTGATGSQGSQGAKGDTGSQGIQGVAGPTGTAGPQGIPGPTGTAGPQGPQGPQGAAAPTSTVVNIISPSNPTGTTNTTGVMMGLGRSPHSYSITPSSSGKVFFTIGGGCSNNTANGGAIVYAAYGSGTPPINGAANTGTPISGGQFRIGVWGASMSTPFSVSGVISGLSPGTPIWMDLSLAVNGSGTASVTGTSLAAFTLP
jgi:hypothetical protein